MKISDIDVNFRSKTSLAEEDIQWFDSFTGAFQIHGASAPASAPPFCRMAPGSLARMNEGVQHLAYHTSGIRLRFRTDSAFIALKAKLSSPDDMSHMPRTGSSGFDLYSRGDNWPVFVKSYMPDASSDVVTGEHHFREGGMKDVTICFPLYNGVEMLSVGLTKNAAVESATPYRCTKPVVFYGSSITQGGCASRPGNSYPAILSRMLDTDIINLGFSGSARGEQEMAEYIASLDMSAFVLDYDHNAPTCGHLQDTHYRLYHAIRTRQPGLPILMLSKPDFDHTSKQDIERRDIIFGTYNKAVQFGDTYVHFIDGEMLFGSSMRDSCTVDGVHPNDLGFMRMAEVICPVLKKLL